MDLVELVKNDRFRKASRVWMKLLRVYFRLEVEGIENIPKKGKAIISPNHSGYSGFDAVLLGHVVLKYRRRIPRILAHRAFFDLSSRVREVSESFGLRKASIGGGAEILKKNRLIVLFPEGESGNFKSSRKAYLLKPFHTGFVRMALESEAPIIPCVIIGAEETHLNLGNINLSKVIKGLRIPLPLNVLPLPAKWRIVFLKPIPIQDLVRNPDSEKQIAAAARKIQTITQKAVRQELKRRPYVYFRQTRKLLEAVKSLPKRVKPQA